MKNERTFLRAMNSLAMLLLAVALLSLAGCHDVLHPGNIPEATPATGSLSLTIEYGMARTIQPEISGIDDFDVFRLELAHQNPDNNFDIPDWAGNPIADLVLGNWTLTVTAYLRDPAGSLVAAARTAAPMPFAVSAGETTILNLVELFPLPAGTGWFSWNLTFPGDTASIRITDLLSGDSVGDAFLVFPGYLDNLELPAGRYRVHLTLHYSGETVTISRILNIYAGMTSPWVETFTVDDFNRPFLDYFLESWDGSWWDLWWVQPGHFDILRDEEGIQGVYPYNFWTIRNQFNAIHRLPWHPGYNTADCLRVLVDAALIATGVQQGIIGHPCCCNETAIRDWVRNGTDITFVGEWDWWDITFPWGWSIPWQWWGYETVAIIGNYYIVGIWLAPPVDPPRCECNPYLCCCDTPHFPSCHCGSSCWCSEHNGWCTWPRCTPCRCDNCWCDNHCLCGNDYGSPAIIFDGNGYWGSIPITIEGCGCCRLWVWRDDGHGWSEYVHGYGFELPRLTDMLYVVDYWNRYWFVMRGWSTDRYATAGDFVFTQHMWDMTRDAFADWQNQTLYAVWSAYGFRFDNGTIHGFNRGSTDIVIPATIGGELVTEIGTWAFSLNQLTSVEIPAGVTYIGEWAFAQNQLTEIVIPEGVTRIRSGAFNINQLTEVVIPEGATYIGSIAFQSNRLIEVVIPESVTYIGSSAFADNQLTSIVIPDGVIYLSGFALNQLTEVVIPSSVISIGSTAFFENQLASVVIPEGVAYIGIQAFQNNQLTSIVIPSSVAYIGIQAFTRNWLTEVVLPDDITSIGSGVFSWNRLASVVIPDSVTYIGRIAFMENPLISITIPGNVQIEASWNTMGIHGESFLAFYNSTGQRAGTYLWLEAENRWILYGDAGEVFVFDIRFTGFADGEASIGFDQSVSVLDPVALITVASAFDEIRWFYAGAPVTGAGIVQGADGETLDFAQLHGNRIGAHFVTVEVRQGGRWYNSQIRINVTR